MAHTITSAFHEARRRNPPPIRRGLNWAPRWWDPEASEWREGFPRSYMSALATRRRGVITDTIRLALEDAPPLVVRAAVREAMNGPGVAFGDERAIDIATRAVRSALDRGIPSPGSDMKSMLFHGGRADA